MGFHLFFKNRETPAAFPAVHWAPNASTPAAGFLNDMNMCWIEKECKSASPNKEKIGTYLVVFVRKWIISWDNSFSNHCIFSSSDDKDKKSAKVNESWILIQVCFWTGPVQLFCHLSRTWRVKICVVSLGNRQGNPSCSSEWGAL